LRYQRGYLAFLDLQLVVRPVLRAPNG